VPKVILDMAMSLDGFIAGANDEDGGLHNYFFSPSEATARVIEDGFKTTGTIIMGRRSYDIGAQQDGFADNPYRVPTFIVSSSTPATRSKGAEDFVFVTDGIESALNQAKAVAGEREVIIGGGALIAQAYLKAGLVDELYIHLVPLLLGKGKLLFNNLGNIPINLEVMDVIEASDVNHIRYRVVK
jgi:dihydrofolate reductase